MVDVLARCTLRSANGIPRDNCINTFAITGATPGTDDSQISLALGNFYTAAPDGLANSVSRYINDTIQRTDGLVIDLISTPGTPPDVPYATFTWSLDAVLTDGCLPQEACVCMSLVSEDYVTAAQPGRHRGRVYIGPLVSLAGADGGPFDVLRPSPGIIGVVTAAGDALIGDMSGDGRSLAVWSRADDVFRGVGGGWVDDEFDTQRRRGRNRTARYLLEPA